MAEWIVMTSQAKMPGSCWGKYRNVALVQLNQEYTAKQLKPKYISTRARGVLRVVHLGHHFDGETDRCAFARALAAAKQRAYDLNNSCDMASAELLINSTCA